MIKISSQKSAIKVSKEGNGRGSFGSKKSFLSYKIFVLTPNVLFPLPLAQRERERERERESLVKIKYRHGCTTQWVF